MAAILVYFIVNYQRRKRDYEIEQREQQLREQALLLEKQKALEEERTRIAAEMHDDIGGGLTTIKYLSEKAMKSTEDPDQRALIGRVVEHSRSLVQNTSEIIWAMNGGFDTLDSLVGYCRHFASEYLHEHDIDLSFRSELQDGKQYVSGEKRRSVFLVTKEALHNTVKHAKADLVSIECKENQGTLDFKIADNGKGLVEKGNEFGNGLSNMKKRIKGIGGELDYHNGDGFELRIKLPVSEIL